MRNGIAKRDTLSPWRRSLVLVAVFTLFLQGFVPLAQALASQISDGPSIVVCTAYGLKTVPPDQPGPAGEDGSDTFCPVCQIHSMTLLAPEQPVLAGPGAFTPVAHDRARSVVLAGLRLSQVRARAPPVSV